MNSHSIDFLKINPDTYRNWILFSKPLDLKWYTFNDSKVTWNWFWIHRHKIPTGREQVGNEPWDLAHADCLRAVHGMNVFLHWGLVSLLFGAWSNHHKLDFKDLSEPKKQTLSSAFSSSISSASAVYFQSPVNEGFWGKYPYGFPNVLWYKQLQM